MLGQAVTYVGNLSKTLCSKENIPQKLPHDHEVAYLLHLTITSSLTWTDVNTQP